MSPAQITSGIGLRESPTGVLCSRQKYFAFFLGRNKCLINSCSGTLVLTLHCSPKSPSWHLFIYLLFFVVSGIKPRFGPCACQASTLHPQHFCFYFVFEVGSCCYPCPDWPWTLSPHSSTHPVSEIIGMSHHTWLRIPLHIRHCCRPNWAIILVIIIFRIIFKFR